MIPLSKLPNFLPHKSRSSISWTHHFIWTYLKVVAPLSAWHTPGPMRQHSEVYYTALWCDFRSIPYTGCKIEPLSAFFHPHRPLLGGSDAWGTATIYVLRLRDSVSTRVWYWGQRLVGFLQVCGCANILTRQRLFSHMKNMCDHFSLCITFHCCVLWVMRCMLSGAEHPWVPLPLSTYPVN